MAKLYELRLLIEKISKEKGLNPSQIKGKIGLLIGEPVGSITENTPDDPAVLAKMKGAIKDVLGVAV